MSLAKAFAHFGAVKSNPVWSWAAKSPDGKTVVITVWDDQATHVDGKLVYDVTARGDLEIWQNRPGNRERIKLLEWAIDHCDSCVRVVHVVAASTAANTRSISRCWPDPNLVLKITKLNTVTGEFYAQSL